MTKASLLNWISAVLGIVAVVMLFLPFLSAEALGKTETVNGLSVIFGNEDKGLAFSFMNFLTLLLVLGGIALAVLSALKGNKLASYGATLCLLLAGIFFFCGLNFFTLVIEEGTPDKFVDGAYELARELYDLGVGAIIAGICSILAAISAVGSTVIDKLLKK